MKSWRSRPMAELLVAAAVTCLATAGVSGTKDLVPAPFVRSTAPVGPTPSNWPTGHQNLRNNAAFLPTRIPWLGKGPWWMDRFRYKLSSDTPVIHGILYLTSGDVHGRSPSQQGTVWAISARTGRIIWRHQLPNNAFSEPVVDHGRVFIGVGNIRFHVLPHSHTLIRGTGVSGIWCFNAATGDLLWVNHTSGSDQPPPTVVGTTLYAVSGSRKLYAIDVANGHRRWTLPLPAYSSRSSPRVVGHMLYLGGAHAYSVIAVNLQTRKIAWVTPIRGAVEGVDDTTLAYGNHRLYTAAVTMAKPGPRGIPQRHAVLYALDASNGHQVWSRVLTTGSPPFLKATGTPTLAGSEIYVGNALTGVVSAVYAGNGHIQWQFNAGSPVKKPPVVTPQRVYFLSLHGTLFALNHQGHLMGKSTLLPAVNVRGPVLANHTLFAIANTATNGYLFAMPRTQIVRPVTRKKA